MQTTTPGVFRSEIYFHGSMYDVEWSQYFSKSDGIDVHVRSITKDGQQFHGKPSPISEFDLALIRRSTQIKIANRLKKKP